MCSLCGRLPGNGYVFHPLSHLEIRSAVSEFVNGFFGPFLIVGEGNLDEGSQHLRLGYYETFMGCDPNCPPLPANAVQRADQKEIKRYSFPGIAYWGRELILNLGKLQQRLHVRLEVIRVHKEG